VEYQSIEKIKGKKLFKYLLFLFTFFSISYASENLDVVTIENAYYTQTKTSLTYKDAKISFNVPSISYIGLRPNYLFLADIKMIPKQKIGTTSLGATPLKLEQEAWKYELGAGYKFHLNKKLYIAPALLYSDYYSKTFTSSPIASVETKSRDVDVRLYGLVGYEPAKATMVILSVELDNDILSDSYKEDYSQYPVNLALYQFVSKDFFFYLKYQKALRNKKATTTSNGSSNNTAYFFGVGISF
jgi:hypothetical protein